MKVENTCKKLGEIILALILWIITVTVIVLPLLFVWLPIIVIRFVEQIVYEKFFGMKRLKSDDVLWMMESPNNQSLINGMMIMESYMPTTSVQQMIQKKFVDVTNSRGEKQYPNATRYIHEGHLNYYWTEEESFDIREHVYEFEKTLYSSKDEMMNVVNQIATRQFVHRNGSSPWEDIVLHFLDDGSPKTCILIHRHHAFGDGVSIINYIVNKMSDEASSQIKTRAMSKTHMIMKLKGYFYMPLTFFNILRLPYPSHKLFCSAVTGEKVLRYSDPINLKLLKAIKNKLKVSINDVLAGCLATIMHEYFADHSKSVPKDIVALYPFDTRYSLDEAETLANKFAIVFVPLPSENGDPLRNVTEMNRRMNALKSSGDHHGMRAGVRLLIYAFPFRVSQFAINMLASHSSIVISNVAGPQVPIEFDGIPVQTMCFWPPATEHITMSMSFLSYQGEVRIALAVDTITEVSPEKLLKSFSNIFYSLAENMELANFINE